MGKKEKAKAARRAGHPYDSTSTRKPEQPEQSTNDTQPARDEGQVRFTCQALIDKNCKTKCGASSTSRDGKWCRYHTQVRLDLHASFHDLLKAYRASAIPMPDMAFIRETVDPDWLENLWKPLRVRIDVLSRCIMSRSCFMEKLQGEDLDFGTKRSLKDLKEARTRLNSYLAVIEARMMVLIYCSHEDQRTIANLCAQQLTRVDKQNQICIHHDERPESGPGFPIGRQFRQVLVGNSIVDTFMRVEERWLRRHLLSKLGVQVVQPTLYGEDCDYELIAHWESIVDHERAHIIAGYFRRTTFDQGHLFVPASFHTADFERDDIRLPRISTPAGDELNVREEVDRSMLCMITFILNPLLRTSHLELLRDYLVWPGHLEVRTAAQDVVLDIIGFNQAQGEQRPFWVDPLRNIFQTGLFDEDPQGTYPVLCGTLYEASFLQATRDDTLEAKFWPHIASLIRCGKCLFATVHSADEWCDVVRTLSVHRVPIYSRILPQVADDSVGDLWSSDRVSDVARGQSCRRRGNDSRGQAPTESLIHADGDGQAPGQTPGRYRVDETLEMAGVVMLGVLAGGQVERNDIADDSLRGLLQMFKILPQVWFFLPTYDRDYTREFLNQLSTRAKASATTFRLSVVLEDADALDVSIDTPPYCNVLQRRVIAPSGWVPKELPFEDIRTLAGLKYDPLPRRISDSYCLVQMSCKTITPNGVQKLLDEILQVAILVNQVDSKAALEVKMETDLERKYGMVTRDHQGRYTYQFHPSRVLAPVDEPEHVFDFDPDDEVRVENETIEGSSKAQIAGNEGDCSGPMDRDRLYETPPTRGDEVSCEAVILNSQSQEESSSSPVGSSIIPSPGCSSPHGAAPTSQPSRTGVGSSASLPNPGSSHHQSKMRTSRQEGDVLSDLGSCETASVATRTEWFDLMMMGEADDLPDLSDWGINLAR